MATQTTNYNLRKPGLNDFYSVEDDFNANMDAIDGVLDNKASAGDVAGLSVIIANMRTNDIEARREIFDIKIKLDEMEVVDYLNKTGIGFFDLFRDTNSVNLPYTTALIQASDVIFSGAKTLQMKQELFSNFTDLELALYDLEREEFEVDVAVNNSKTISMDVTPGTRSAGEKFWYNGQIYTIATVVES